MNIFQVVSSLNYGDAVGNDVIAIKHIIEDMGFETSIYCENLSPKVKETSVYNITKIPKIGQDDIIIYHMANGSSLNGVIAKLNCRKIMIYHNITPPEFFSIDNINAVNSCKKALDDMVKLKGRFNSYIADSYFNKKCMIEMGYKENEIEVIPVAVPFEDYRQKPDPATVSKYSDGITNIVFVGRVAPNKKHEDIIRAFAYYNKNINPDSRLILAGSPNKNGMYYGDLLDYIKAIGVKNIEFAGHISFAQILSIYSTADVFLCLSEHEGFCVPLLEAMTFNVPVIAYDAGAVAETMGESGIVVDDKDPVYLSKIIDELVKNKALRDQIIQLQQKRLENFEYEKIKEQFQAYLRSFINDYPKITPKDPSEGYKKLYSIVESRMNQENQNMEFTCEALLYSAVRTPSIADITELINCDFSSAGLIESAYIALLNRLPASEERSYWENVSENISRRDLIRRMVTLLASKKECKSQALVSYNPFSNLTAISEDINAVGG